MFSRVLAVVAVVLTAGAPVLLPTPGPAAAQPAPAIRVVLDDITTLLAPGTTMRLAVSTTSAPPPGVDLALAVYPRVGSRSEFALAVDGVLQRNPLDVQPYDLAKVPKNGRSWLIERPVAGADVEPADPLLLRQEGVYPVTVTLRAADGTELDRLVTFVVFFPEPRLPPYFRVALVTGVRATSARQPSGTLGRGLEAVITTRVQPQAALVTAAHQRSIPLTVAVRGVTLDEWDELAGTGSVTPPVLPATGIEYIAEPYAGPSAAVLAEQRLGSEISLQIERGRAALTDRGLAPATELAVAPPGGPGPRSARTLARHGARRFLIDEAALAPLTLDLTLTRPFQVDAAGVVVEAVAADTVLSAALARPTDQPRAVAARVLAELTVLYLDAPGEERGAVIALPEEATPNPDIWEPLLDDIDAAGYLLPVGLSRFFADVPFARDGADAQRRLIRTFRSSEPALPDAFVEAINSARTRVGHLQSMIGDTEASRLAGELVTVALGSAGDETGFVTAVDGLVQHEVGLVQSFAGSVTLAAPRGDVPVTLDNQHPTDVTVTVTFDTDRLRFPDGRSRVVSVAPRRHTLSIPVEALTTGSVPLDVVITSPCTGTAATCDSALVVARNRITVTSTKVSAVAVVVAGGALGFLLLWWGRQILSHPRRKRAARRRLTEATASATQEDP